LGICPWPERPVDDILEVVKRAHGLGAEGESRRRQFAG